ncbi:MAG: hypothetical protein CMF74_16460 [Maricaulis sp.]|jgi:hypothetical protein|nr:hypothetical protein [Maricaulis sp.]|tara:strand:+ start:832 stop:1527 length:696 start_codon:yes stop_codon:yes gene_type:complete
MDIFFDNFIKNGKHLRWVSINKTNPFAFTMDNHFWHDKINIKLINKVKKFILTKKEYNIKHNEFIDQTKNDTYWISNNIFKEENKEIKILKKEIKKILNNFFKQINLKLNEKIYIQGWPSILKKNQFHKEHFHEAHEFSFLSGNIILTNNKTTTDYYIYPRSCQFGYYKHKNFSGSITLFSSFIPHKVDTIKDKFRMSIGFNLYTQKSIDYFNETIENQIPLSPIRFVVEL